MSYFPLLILGVLISVFGIINIKGNISTIHWYNRRKVKDEDIPKYGRAMGIGTLTIGCSVLITAILQMIFDFEPLMLIVAIGCIIGVFIMLYAQIKYNKGIF